VREVGHEAFDQAYVLLIHRAASMPRRNRSAEVASVLVAHFGQAKRKKLDLMDGAKYHGAMVLTSVAAVVLTAPPQKVAKLAAWVEANETPSCAVSVQVEIAPA
jgi:hypothetical protein